MTDELRNRPGDQRLPDGDTSLTDDQEYLMNTIRSRRELGIRRYGQGHRPFNGRDTFQDLFDEQLDFLVYLASIKRMSEATRDDLVEAVTRELRENWSSKAVAEGVERDVATAVVDRIMGWVVGEHVKQIDGLQESLEVLDFQDPPVSKTTRVTQQWPIDLKQQVHEVAGSRGVTAFTLAALQARLMDEDRVAVLDREVGELRYLCQLLADRYVMGGTAADREAALMEVELPSWMDTTGWPDTLARQVQKPEKPAPVARKPRPPVAPPQEPVAEPSRVDDLFVAPGGSDLLSRVQAKAMEKGVDITGAGLVPASEVPTPEPRNHVEVAPLEEPVEAPIERAPAEEREGAGLYALCPKCKDPLVGRECWTCA